MDTDNAAALKAKFDELYKTIESYGSASKQLISAKDSFELLSMQMESLVGKCDEYMASVNELATKDITEKLRDSVADAMALSEQCRRQCEDISKQYEENARQFKADSVLGVLADNQNLLLKAIKDNQSELKTQTSDSSSDILKQLDAVSGKICSSIAILEKDTGNSISSSSKEISALYSDLQKTLTGKADTLAGSLSKSFKDSIENAEKQNSEAGSKRVSDAANSVICRLDELNQKTNEQTAQLAESLADTFKSSIEQTKQQSIGEISLKISEAVTLVASHLDELSFKTQEQTEQLADISRSILDRQNDLAEKFENLRNEMIAAINSGNEKTARDITADINQTKGFLEAKIASQGSLSKLAVAFSAVAAIAAIIGLLI